MYVQLLRRVLQRTAILQERGHRQISGIIGILAAQHLIYVPIQFLTRVIITQQRTLRQQLVGTQRTGRSGQRRSRLQREHRLTQRMRSPRHTGTDRAQIQWLVLAERRHDRGTGHLRRDRAHLASQSQQESAVRADDHMLATQIAHRLADGEGCRGKTGRRHPADRKTVEIALPSENVHQGDHTIVGHVRQQAFESQPLDGRIVGMA